MSLSHLEVPTPERHRGVLGGLRVLCTAGELTWAGCNHLKHGRNGAGARESAGKQGSFEFLVRRHCFQEAFSGPSEVSQNLDFSDEIRILVEEKKRERERLCHMIVYKT